MPKKDFSQVAFDVVQQATGEKAKPQEPTARQEAGRKGGVKGGAARADALSKEKRSEIASNAAKSRWDQKAK